MGSMHCVNAMNCSEKEPGEICYAKDGIEQIKGVKTKATETFLLNAAYKVLTASNETEENDFNPQLIMLKSRFANQNLLKILSRVDVRYQEESAVRGKNYHKGGAAIIFPSMLVVDMTAYDDAVVENYNQLNEDAKRDNYRRGLWHGGLLVGAGVFTGAGAWFYLNRQR